MSRWAGLLRWGIAAPPRSAAINRIARGGAKAGPRATIAGAVFRHGACELTVHLIHTGPTGRTLRQRLSAGCAGVGTVDFGVA